MMQYWREQGSATAGIGDGRNGAVSGGADRGDGELDRRGRQLHYVPGAVGSRRAADRGQVLVRDGLIPLPPAQVTLLFLSAGFRHALWTHRSQLPRLALLAMTGGGFGAWLLLQTPPATFSRAIPWLLLLATILLIWGEALRARLRRLFGGRRTFSWLGGTLLVLLFWLICAYGGFFNAGLGIILLGYLTLAGYEDIHLMNGLKLLVSAIGRGDGHHRVWRRRGHRLA